MQSGEERCLEIEIIDDNVTERTYKYFYFALGVYNNVPTNCQYGSIGIQDNESKLLTNGFITSAWSNMLFSNFMSYDTYFDEWRTVNVTFSGMAGNRSICWLDKEQKVLCKTHLCNHVTVLSISGVYPGGFQGGSYEILYAKLVDK